MAPTIMFVSLLLILGFSAGADPSTNPNPAARKIYNRLFGLTGAGFTISALYAVLSHWTGTAGAYKQILKIISLLVLGIYIGSNHHPGFRKFLSKLGISLPKE
ncbi:hypothetical protein GCM10028811_03310 [Uliginosibacterium sediminicola]